MCIRDSHSSASSAARPRSGPRALSGGGAATCVAGGSTGAPVSSPGVTTGERARTPTTRPSSSSPSQSLSVSASAAGALGLDTAEREGWWSGYDWVVRLNPDVIIRDDAFLRTQMARDDVDAIVANCNKGRVVRVMTDFTAWRPAKIPAGAFRPVSYTHLTLPTKRIV